MSDDPFPKSPKEGLRGNHEVGLVLVTRASSDTNALVASQVMLSRISYLVRLLRCPGGVFPDCLCVLLNSQFPRRLKCHEMSVLIS
jgi:hypothetical protein